jgi:hypothetical protein
VRSRIVAFRDLARPGKRRVEVDRGIEFAADQTPLVSGPELGPGIADGIAGRLAEPAMAGAAQKLGEPHEFVDLIARTSPLGDLIERVAHERSANAARRAETAALMGEEMGEVACGFEQVAILAEHHEGAGGRDILEGNVTPELVRSEAYSRRAADLHRGDVARAAILEHLLDAHAERVFVKPRPRAIAGYRQNLGARRVPRAAPGEHPAAVERDLGRLREGLDIVDNRRLAEIADRHWERRANARLARLAFERFDQRRFLAADVGARA